VSTTQFLDLEPTLSCAWAYPWYDETLNTTKSGTCRLRYVLSVPKQIILRSIHKVKVKIKVTLEQATEAQRGVQLQLYSSLNLGARWDGSLMPRPGPFTLGKDLVPVVLGGPQGRSGRMRKFSPTPGFDPQAVKPVASRSFD
jgi:hypothetical protein